MTACDTEPARTRHSPSSLEARWRPPFQKPVVLGAGQRLHVHLMRRAVWERCPALSAGIASSVSHSLARAVKPQRSKPRRFRKRIATTNNDLSLQPVLFRATYTSTLKFQPNPCPASSPAGVVVAGVV
jgi:hypothetical protein